MSRAVAALPPVLLTTPENCGTLAAARCLGAAGYPVWVAGETTDAPVMHSRFVTGTLTCPPLDGSGAMLEWLLDFGRRHPGAVLYPTSDDFAWFQGVHRAELAPHFRLYAPGGEVFDALLDKHALHQLCEKVGLETPPSFAPADEAELEAAARTIPLPVLIKQRTQLFSASRDKGELVTEREALAPAARAYIARNQRGAAVTERLPWASRPVLQTYFAEGVDGSLQVSGFIDETGELFVTRGCAKILQRPRRMGLSLCLEDAPVPPALAEGIRALCREAGYWGVFELEFLRVGGRFLLIDFNPRYYHYLAFCIARGMPLPLLTALGARGEKVALREAVLQAERAQGSGPRAFAYRYQLEELLLAQGLAGTMPLAEVAHWVRWYLRHWHSMADAVAYPGDLVPRVVDVGQSVAHAARHPRAFLRQIAEVG